MSARVKRRPMGSASRAANRASAAQPGRIEATAKPVPAELGLKAAWLLGTDPLMTALSKPKRKPPKAALPATKLA